MTPAAIRWMSPARSTPPHMRMSSAAKGAQA